MTLAGGDGVLNDTATATSPLIKVAVFCESASRALATNVNESIVYIFMTVSPVARFLAGTI